MSVFFLQERSVHPGGAGRLGAADVEAGSGWRGDGFIHTCPSVPVPPRSRPPQPLHHLLSGPQLAIPALHLPGALQVCVDKMTRTFHLFYFSFTATSFIVKYLLDS